MKTASRTLVKSAPEVWEQLDHPGRMQGLMSALVGHAAEVEIYERVEESKLAWRADDARIEVKLAEKGWGTNVSVSAENGTQPTKLEGWLDAVLDELATPTKRPFGGMSEAPAGTVPALSALQQAQPGDEDEETDDEPAKEPAEEPVAEQPPAEPAEPPAKPKPPRKKLFGFLRF
jgi:hypothetical protein